MRLVSWTGFIYSRSIKELCRYHSSFTHCQGCPLWTKYANKYCLHCKVYDTNTSQNVSIHRITKHHRYLHISVTWKCINKLVQWEYFQVTSFLFNLLSYWTDGVCGGNSALPVSTGDNFGCNREWYAKIIVIVPASSSILPSSLV